MKCSIEEQGGKREERVEGEKVNVLDQLEQSEGLASIQLGR